MEARVQITVIVVDVEGDIASFSGWHYVEWFRVRWRYAFFYCTGLGWHLNLKF